MKLFLKLILITSFFSCLEDKPYKEFEENLTKEICDCISIGEIKKENSSENFMIRYANCMEKTSGLLKKGLSNYPEDPRISKEEYLQKLPLLIQQIVKKKCR